MELATSDAHPGLIQALKEAFPGLIWQRCQAHFRRNVLDRTPSGYRDRMHQITGQLLEAPSQKEAQSRFEEIADELEKRAEAALEVLEEGLIDATAVLALPGKYRRRLRTTKRGPSGLSKKFGVGRRSSGSFQTENRLTGSLAPSVRKLMKSGQRAGDTWT
ncbi:transposase-like protein [Salinibacter ruber]|nr:transposase-like protein [Salinibacter ruber]